MGEVDETVVDEKLRARILACAIAAGALDDEALTNANALSLFAGRELVLRGSRLTDRGLRLATAASPAGCSSSTSRGASGASPTPA